MGASVGHFLAKIGFGKIVLLEKRTFAAVSTGHSAANLRCAYSNPVTVQLALRAFDLFENDRDKLGGDTGFQRTGMMALLDEAHVAIGRAVLASEAPHNTGTQEIDPEQIKELAPQIELGDVVCATYQPRGGYADPVRTTQTLVQQAQKWGLTAYEGVEAKSIQTEGDRVSGVETDQGTIQTRIVVNAAGPWGGRIGSTAGRVYSIRWSRESDLLLKLPAGFGKFPIIADPACQIYFRPQSNDRLLAGLDYPKELEPLDIEDYDPDLDAPTRQRIEEGLFKRIPVLKDATFDRGWASIYTITEDWHPVVGPEQGIDGYFACFGGSGHGFKLGPPIGESLAAMIAGKSPRIDLHTLRPSRFEQGELFASAWGAGNRAYPPPKKRQALIHGNPGTHPFNSPRSREIGACP